MTRLVALEIGGEIQPWEALGLPVSQQSVFIADVEIRFVGGEPGLRSWTFCVDGYEGPPRVASVDGIATTVVAESGVAADVRNEAGSLWGRHRVVGLDHVVVNTSEPLRTCAAIEEVLGLAVKRVREVGNGYEQRFHRADNTIIEVVSGPQVPPGDARLWGMVASIDDLDALAAELGEDLTSVPKQAVQPGRRISTLRSTAGLGVPFALMSPHQR